MTSRVPKWLLNYHPAPLDLRDFRRCDETIAWAFDPWSQEEAAEHGVEAVEDRVTLAKQICAKCPVAQECLTYGLTNELTGVYGGTLITEAELRRRRAAKEDDGGGSDRHLDAGPGKGVVDDDRSEVHGGRRQGVQADLRAPTVLSAERDFPQAG